VNTQIIIADDVWTSGNTIMSLIDKIAELQSVNNIRSITTLAASRYGKNIADKNNVLTEILKKVNVDVNSLNTLVRTHTIYKDYDIRRATESELRILNGRIKSGIRAEELVSIIAGGEENSISGTGSGSKGDYSGGRGIPDRASRTSNLQEINGPNSLLEDQSSLLSSVTAGIALKEYGKSIILSPWKNDGG
jgi:hypothetical protein